MDAHFWHQRWERNEIGFHQPEINLHLQEFWSELQVAPGSPVFVPLCGKSRDMLWLCGEGHRVLGNELSPIAVRAFFEENQLTAETRDSGRFVRWESECVTILCGDYFHLGAEDLAGVAAVYDRASLIALPVDMRQRYASHLISLLASRAAVLLVTLEYPDGEMQGPPFSVSEQEVHALYGHAFHIRSLQIRDVLLENPRMREKGLTGLVERVFVLEPNS